MHFIAPERSRPLPKIERPKELELPGPHGILLSRCHFGDLGRFASPQICGPLPLIAGPSSFE